MAEPALAPEPGAAPAGVAAPQAPPALQAILIVDDRRKLIEANASACLLIGKDRDRIVGRSLDVLLEPPMRERIRHVWKAFAEGGGNAGPFTLVSGEEIQVSMAPNLQDDRHLLVLSPVAPTESLPAPGAVAPAEAPTAPGAPRAVRSAGRDPSPRELEILALLAEGETDPQIADRLGLSPATVQTHVRNAKAKLGARTRAQAVALGLERGLIVR